MRTNFPIQKVDSVAKVFDTLQTNRLDNQIWKWWLSCTTFLVTDGNPLIYEINYLFL
jgi:hypothetical protein